MSGPEPEEDCIDLQCYERMPDAETMAKFQHAMLCFDLLRCKAIINPYNRTTVVSTPQKFTAVLDRLHMWLTAKGITTVKSSMDYCMLYPSEIKVDSLIIAFSLDRYPDIWQSIYEHVVPDHIHDKYYETWCNIAPQI